MSAGSNKSPPDSDEDHLIPISPWIILNKNLTLKEMEEFFSKLKQQHYEQCFLYHIILNQKNFDLLYLAYIIAYKIRNKYYNNYFIAI